MIDEPIDKELAHDHSTLAVLPTIDLVSWLHKRAEFIGKKNRGRSPEHKGCIYGDTAWLYWHHDFLKQCLFIQRIRVFIKQKNTRQDVLENLLIHALVEARKWQLPAIVIWDAGPDVHDAINSLNGTIHSINLLRKRVEPLVPILKDQRREKVSLRFRGGQKKYVLMKPNEHYAWN